MKCVVADWEIRNLGCKTLECTVEKGDNKESIANEIDKLQQEHQAKYIVVKNSHQFANLNWKIQEMGFYFIEDQLAICMRRDKAIKKTEQMEFRFRNVSWHEVTLGELPYITKEVGRGIFYTDRVAMDPYFGLELANRRYIGWIGDVVESGGKLFVVKIKNREVGFFLSQYKDNHVDGILSGLYKKNSGVGMGGAIVYAGVKDFLNNDKAKFYKSSLSTNNLSIIRLDTSFGFEICDIHHVFVKHYN